MNPSLLPHERAGANARGREAIERALRESEAYFRSLVENVRDIIHVVNRDGTTRYVSPSVTRLLGWDAEDLIGRAADDLVHPDDREHVRDLLRRKRSQPTGGSTIELRIAHRDGTWRTVEAVARNLLDDAAVDGIVINSRDVTERRRAEDERARLAAFPRESPNPILECDGSGRIVYANPAVERIVAELELGSTDWLLPPEHADLVRRCVGSGEPVRGVETVVRGRVFSWTYHAHPALHTVHLFAEEITESKRVQERLLHHALHDALTGLPNRNLFLQRLADVLRAAARRASGTFAVLFLDLDRFKVVNDSLGHQVGDEMLIEIAQRIRASARPGDTVARFGGDEFAVLLHDVDGAREALAMAEHLVAAVASPVLVGEYELFTTASAGIALGGSIPDERPEDLLRNADMAMYRAKAAGAGRCELFGREMHHAALARLELETDLRRAVERAEFRLCYQPIVAVRTGRMHGVEALVRWEHPRRGLVPPSEFIPTAEETGVILPLGNWVLRHACTELAGWRRDFPGLHVGISVNLSAKQFTQPDLVEQITRALADARLDPRFLKLEITESALLENTEIIHGMLHRLRATGVQIQMDDFGTGYSSLGALHTLPIDTLKIDRSFIARIFDGQSTAPLVHTIVVLARGLGLATVAEGVETAEQLQAIRDLGCDFAQGYLFSPPVDADELRSQLAREITDRVH